MAKKSANPKALTHHVCPTCADAAQASAAASNTKTTNAARCLSLAGRVCDQVADLSIAVNGYIALERFVSPNYADETQASVAPSRLELAAMLRALNAQVMRHIDALELGTTVLQAEMGDDDAVLAR